MARFSPPNNNITTDEIRYFANTKTATNNGGLIQSDLEGDGINVSIKESNFIYLHEFTYNNLSTGTQVSNPNTLYPFTYLEVDVDPPETFTNTAISPNSANDHIVITGQSTAIYVHATAVIYESPTEYSYNNGALNFLSQGIVFEHYGTVTPRYSSDIYSGQPSENEFSRLRFNSEFNIIDTLDYTGIPNYNEQQGNYPGEDIYTNNLFTAFDYNAHSYNNLIYFDRTNNKFKCKIAPNSFVVLRNANFWDNISPFTSYSILIRGTYLLM